MKNNDKVLQMIARYCAKYNQKNKKEINYPLLYIPFSVIAPFVLYYWNNVSIFLCVMLFVIIISYILKYYFDRKLSPNRLQAIYKLYKGEKRKMGLVSDEFLNDFADDKNIPEIVKYMLAERLKENNGEVYWSDVFDIRDEYMLSQQEQERLKNPGAQKLYHYSEKRKESGREDS
ncbi:hypothetical protein [Citrobacter freundii]|uniref:hypothetical protein n=1 Tax=Citrobacter freundii TaxID=546 RepID=UPI00174B716E|nr:hypothetical protein [Citrobacter freundii]MBD5662449.1 hypothetical protein [Citrobacter freundii]